MADDNNLNINIGINPAGAEAGARRVTSAVGSVSNETKDLDSAFRRLKSAIDPTYAAQERYNRSVAEYDRLLKTGKINQQEYAAAVGLVKTAYDNQLSSIERNGSAAKRVAQESAAAALAESRARESAAADNVRLANEWLAAERRNSAAIKAEVASRLTAEKAAIREAVAAARQAAAEKVAAERTGGATVTKAAETQRIRDAAAAARIAARERADAEREADAQIVQSYQATYATAKAIVQDAATEAAQAAQQRATAERVLIEATGNLEKAERREAAQAAREAAAAATQAAQQRVTAEKQAARATEETKRATEAAAIAARREADAVNEMRASINPTLAAQMRYNDTMAKATQLLMANKLQSGEWVQIQKQARTQMDLNVRSMGRMNQVNVQMGYQMQDVIASWGSGISPLVILAQQGGQTASALSQLGGTTGKVAAFFAGPWGAAILGAVMVLGFLWQANKDAESSTKDVMNAEDRRKMSVKELTEALREFVKQQKEANNTLIENNRLTQQATVDTSNEVIKQRTDAMTKLRNLQEQMKNLEAGSAGMDPTAYAAAYGALAAQIFFAERAVKSLETAYKSAVEANTEASIKSAADMADKTELEVREMMEKNALIGAYRRDYAAAAGDQMKQMDMQADLQKALNALSEKYDALKKKEQQSEREAGRIAREEIRTTYQSREDAIGKAGRALKQAGFGVSENFQFGKVGEHPGMGREAHGKYAIDLNIPGAGTEADNSVYKKRMDDMVAKYQAAGFRILWNGKVYEPHGGGASYDIKPGAHQHRNHAHMEAPRSIVGKPAGTALAGELENAFEAQRKDEHEAQIADIEFKKQMANEDLSIQLTLQDQKIAAQRAFFGAGSREELDAMRERARIQQQYDRMSVEEKKRQIDQRVSLEVAGVDREAAARAAGVEAQRTMIDFLQAQGLIGERQALAQKAALIDQEYQQEVAHTNRLHALQVQALRDKLSLTTAPDQRAQLHRQIETAEAEHLGRMQQLQIKYDTDVRTVQQNSMAQTMGRWRDVVGTFTGSLGSAFQGLWTKTTSFQQTMINMADQMVYKFFDMGVQMLSNWIMTQLGLTTVQKVQEGVRTASTSATAATQTSIQAATTSAAVAAEGIKTAAAVTGATTQTGVAAAAGMSEVGTNAAVAAAGAYKSTVVIPFIGPIAAPAAAALALAAVMGFGALISAKGGLDEVPGDQLAMVHKKEMILPAWIAEPMRQSLKAGNSAGMMSGAVAAGTAARSWQMQQGDRYEFNYQPSNTAMNADLSTLLRQDASTLRKWIKNEMRNGTLKLTGK